MESAACVESCIDDIRVWMAENRLVLNGNKTEVIHFHSRHSRKMKILEELRVGITYIKPSPTVRDLGVFFDEYSTMSSHISNLSQIASFALFRIGKIRRILDRT